MSEKTVKNEDNKPEQAKEKEDKNSASFRTIFTCKHINESFGVAFRKREHGLRHVIVIGKEGLTRSSLDQKFEIVV